jgi:hypothetical protein
VENTQLLCKGTAEHSKDYMETDNQMATKL